LLANWDFREAAFGYGSFSSLKRCYPKIPNPTDPKFAMKIIPKDKYEIYSKLVDLRNQIQNILHLDHPHVVPIQNF
jgi:serine/threonine protein kinase